MRWIQSFGRPSLDTGGVHTSLVTLWHTQVDTKNTNLTCVFLIGLPNTSSLDHLTHTHTHMHTLSLPPSLPPSLMQSTLTLHHGMGKCT